ncbi:MAG TPA: NAD(P)-dependent oxidoreductase [Baekduia sp.]|uniref:NAD-dependent epimerase/dehydratase family protein n=1 Tax=Baekduia sp. TaxID=2600305 RepID=UPI002D767EC0|nr:NAD(P)-dependent oxidoreductase [Baekduia sp.]HET6509969.1 NAD(P)-dependent oxidoreductase [Baekduia sp.]
MRIVIVGAKGFVGASLTRGLLARGHEVVSLDLRPGPGRLADVEDEVEWVVGDGSAPEAMLAAIGRRPVDGIYYGPYYRAAPGEPGLGQELDVMAVAAWRVFQLARGLDLSRVIFPSSTAVHGRQPADGAPLDETSRVAPFGLYGAYKLLCEGVGEQVNAAVGRNVITSVRLPAIYGPGAAVASRGVNVPAVAAARGEAGRVDYRPEVRVCVAHVDDAAAMLVRAFEHDDLAHAVYDMGGADVSFGEIAQVVQDLVPDARTEFGDDVAMPLPSAIDNARARAELGVEHRDLREGMASVVDYERSRLGAAA